MDTYVIREVKDADIDMIVSIYNSNHKFLVNHLGMDAVDHNFIREEILDMTSNHFLSCVIVNESTHEMIGVIDYKLDSTVYLSLLMIHSNHQKKRIGQMVYNHFETNMFNLGKGSIRIDVINDYADNVVWFWQKQGFIQQNEVNINWGNKKSTAVVMLKPLE